MTKMLLSETQDIQLTNKLKTIEPDPEEYKSNSNTDKYIQSPILPENPDISEVDFTYIGGTLKCSKYKYKTSKKSLIKRHCQIHMNIRKFECTICEHSFTGMHHLKNHKKLHSGSKQYQCQECDGNYKTMSELHRHVRYKHTHEKPFKCTECSYAAVERSKLVRHMKSHTGERPHQCPHCSYASADTFKLKRHLRSHTGEKPYKCDVCNSEYTQANSLKTHYERVHTKIGLDKYSCPICYATYAKMSALRFHMENVHSNIGLLRCPKCNDCFTDRYTLKNHVRTHKRKRKYQCSICPHTTWTKKKFLAHTSQHNIGQFKCDTCNSKFLSQCTLTRHEKLVHDNKSEKYTCHECGKVYLLKKNLERHLQLYCKPLSIKTEKDQESNNSTDLSTIANNLEDGEVIVLPEKGGEQYVMIEILPDQNDVSDPTVKFPDPPTVKEENDLKEFYVEIEDNKLEIKLEVESDIEMTEEDEEPFLGF